MQKMLIWVVLVMLCCPAWAAGPNQDMAVLEKQAATFVQQELSTRQNATFRLGALSRHLVVPVCQQPVVTWANPLQTTGSTSLNLSCPEVGWTLRLPVTIIEKKMGVVLNHQVMAGDILQAGDVRLMEINPALARNALIDMSKAVGQSMRVSAPEGAVLQSYMVRAPFLVKANQPVRVVATGDEFIVSSEGVSLGNGAEGELVSVRMSSGRVVRGIVQQDGSIAINY